MKSVTLSVLIYLQVGTNGIVSFGAEFPHFDASPFPTSVASSYYAYVAAPFWSDIDARQEGFIWYEVHDAAESNPVSNTLLSSVNDFIQTEAGVEFEGNLMIVATWDHVHPWPHGDGTGQELVDPYLQSVSLCYKLYVYHCHCW